MFLSIDVYVEVSVKTEVFSCSDDFLLSSGSCVTDTSQLPVPTGLLFTRSQNFPDVGRFGFLVLFAFLGLLTVRSCQVCSGS